MLAISPTAQGALAAYARPAFAVRVRKALAEKYPHLLPRFPEPFQDAITGNMLGRAASWGLSQQAALLGYCELMITVAANFDEEPEIRQALENAPEPRDFTLRTLPHAVAKPAWTRAARRASTLPLFVAPSLAGAAIPEQTVAALPLALFDRPEVHNARAAVTQAMGTVVELNMKGLADALLVVAACRSFWGAGFPALAWMVDLQRRQTPPHVLIAALRCRLALEFGRFL